ncbi:MAG: hypothetical protein Q4P20_10320 [Eubacteriales bacterium]|nr:hypothetical protein [Eubacteriales bacterium]
MMRQKTAPIDNAPLRDSRELAKMLARLPEQERLKIEGIIIGVSIASKYPAQQVDTENAKREM